MRTVTITQFVATAMLTMAMLPAFASGESSAPAMEFTAGWTTLFQHLPEGSTDSGRADSKANTRVDLALSVPAPMSGAVAGTFFLHARGGVGAGVSDMPAAASGTNATTFASPDGHVAARLVEAWYQVNVPAGGGGHLEFTAGKLDPFVFFDQNAVSDDEIQAFLNPLFVHNPLLDAGGDVGVDDFGFSPGVRAAYSTLGDQGRGFTLSAAAFGAGEGARFRHPSRRPFAIFQAELQTAGSADRESHYRLYAWQNLQAFDLAGDSQIHRGLGLSIDQALGPVTTLFARLGVQSRGQAPFDRAATFGATWTGAHWQRPDDAVGVAVAWRHASHAFRSAAPSLDSDGDGVLDFGYPAGSGETTYEFFWVFVNSCG